MSDLPGSPQPPSARGAGEGRRKPFDVVNAPLDGIRLVEASAGTGKTWNICGLYLRLLIERALPVKEILVVTFTNAATAELRERVRT
ncbi:MAG TPA: UvrD-helicase domain-containing protein, partial [Casimicrobiaceae bacterium]